MRLFIEFVVKEFTILFLMIVACVGKLEAQNHHQLKYFQPVQVNSDLWPEPDPSISFRDKSGRIQWPLTAFNDYAVSFVSLYRIIRLEYSFYSCLKQDCLAAVKSYGDRKGSLLVKINRYTKSYERQVLQSLSIWGQADRVKQTLTRTPTIFDILKHPLLILSTIDRCVHQLKPLYLLLMKEVPKLRTVLFSTDNADNDNDIENQYWPTISDLTEYYVLLHNLVYTHDLNVSHIVQGVFDGITTNVKLDGFHTMKIGALMSIKNFHASAVSWAWEAYQIQSKCEAQDLCNNSDSKSRTSVSETKETLKRVAERHDTDFFLNPYSTENYYSFSSPVNEDFDRIPLLKLNKIKLQNELLHKNVSDIDEDLYLLRFMTLCQKENSLQTEDIKRHLNCWCDRTIPIFPFKFELLHKNPVLLFIHDFIPTTLSTYLIEKSYGHLKRSPTTYTLDDPEEMFTHEEIHSRASTMTLLHKNLKHPHKEYLQLEERIKLVTGLNVVGENGESSPFQVTSSLPGGHFWLHFDGKVEEIDTRVATFIIYLHEEEIVGGRTAFPLLGVSVEPKPRSALFWYNFGRDGEVETGALHGGCPVILGRKWTTMKVLGAQWNTFCRESDEQHYGMKPPKFHVHA